MLPTKIYTFTIPAAGMFELPVLGEFFKVLSASGTFTAASDTYGVVGALLPGQGVKDAPFNKLQFVDTSGASNNLKVLVAAASFIDDRIAGEVSVVDGGKARTLSNATFMATVFQAAVAAQMSQCQLWNPGATGKNLVVEAVNMMTSGASGTFGAGAKNATLATAYQAPGPKLLGGSASVAQSFTQAAAASLITAGSQILALNGTTNQLVSYRFVEPVVVRPGFGLVLWNNILNADLSATFEFFEELVQ